jgi:curli biogenesis system outer membrane secretion channel CsgG
MKSRKVNGLLLAVAAALAPSLHGCAPTAQAVFTAKPSRMGRIRVIAVAPFAGPERFSARMFHLGMVEEEPGSEETLAAKMSEKILGCGEFTLVERAQLLDIVEEQELSGTDLFDPRTAAKLGKLLGADAVLIGSIQRAENFHRMSICCFRLLATVRLVDVNTAEVLMVANIDRGLEIGQRGLITSKAMDEESTAIASQLAQQARQGR